MFEKIKEILGVGKADAAALIRAISRKEVTHDVLFEPENRHVLKAYVTYGHVIPQRYQPEFFKTADKELVKMYLEMGFSLDEESRQAVVDRRDGELLQIMFDACSWVPFPYGNACSHTTEHVHHEIDACDPSGLSVSLG